MPLLVAVEPVDVGIDGGITPVEEQAWLCQLCEVFVGIAVVHAVVLLLSTVPHGVIDEVATLLAVGPAIGGVPDRLWCPHAVDGGPVLIDALCLGVAEDGRATAIVQRCRFPVNEVVGAQQCDAIVVPLRLFLQLFESPHVHVGTEHEVARAVVTTEDVGIAGSPLDACMLSIAEDGVATKQVVVVQSVATQRISRPRPSVTVHVAVEITIIAHLRVLCLCGGQPECEQRHC